MTRSACIDDVRRAWDSLIADKRAAARDAEGGAARGASVGDFPHSLLLVDDDLVSAEAQEWLARLRELLPQPTVILANSDRAHKLTREGPVAADSLTRRLWESVRREGPRAFEELPEPLTRVSLTQEISLNLRDYSLLNAGRVIALCRGETLLLLYLASEPGRWRSTAAISRDVFERVDPAGLKLAYKYVSTARRKLTPYSRLLEGCRRRGYRLHA